MLSFWWLIVVVALLCGALPAVWESWRDPDVEDIDWRDEL